MKGRATGGVRLSYMFCSYNNIDTTGSDVTQLKGERVGSDMSQTVSIQLLPLPPVGRKSDEKMTDRLINLRDGVNLTIS